MPKPLQTGLTYPEALQHLINGQGGKIARESWEGTAWVTYSPGGVIASDDFWAAANKAFAIQNGGQAEVLPYLTLKTVDNCIVPWSPGQRDQLSDDWEILE